LYLIYHSANHIMPIKAFITWAKNNTSILIPIIMISPKKIMPTEIITIITIQIILMRIMNIIIVIAIEIVKWAIVAISHDTNRLVSTLIIKVTNLVQITPREATQVHLQIIKIIINWVKTIEPQYYQPMELIVYRKKKEAITKV